jgi:diaminohydroxyphosphoribosylaminopyrimidine deaminase/5-amino-6-(5-phosphoribosylamino)uracil reductase
MSDSDIEYLRRAIHLAMNGRGAVEPNPMVGCVIVKDGRIIGEGYHAKFGKAHAEPNALASCSESPHGATAYATLEPCCHTDKKTPPCVPRLIDAKIARVVIGCLDPSPQVNGKGIAMLREAGIEVLAPCIEGEPKQLIAPFIARVIHHRPYVTMKWAQSANGQVAGKMGRAVKITNAVSDRVMHELRARCDAIAVGTNTVLNDDPLLTARGVESFRSRRLVRVVLSNSLKIPLTSRLVQTAREHPLIVYCSQTSFVQDARHVESLRAVGAQVVPLPLRGENRFSFTDVLSDLHQREVTHLLIEPGPTLTKYFLARGQADRIWVFRSRKQIEDAEGFTTAYAPTNDYPSSGEVNLNGDLLTEYLNPQSPIFFKIASSADLELARVHQAAIGCSVSRK